MYFVRRRTRDEQERDDDLVHLAKIHKQDQEEKLEAEWLANQARAERELREEAELAGINPSALEVPEIQQALRDSVRRRDAIVEAARFSDYRGVTRSGPDPFPGNITVWHRFWDGGWLVYLCIALAVAAIPVGLYISYHIDKGIEAKNAEIQEFHQGKRDTVTLGENVFTREPNNEQ